jgi:hypothetical protein
MMRFMAGENKYIEKLKSGFRNQAFFVVKLVKLSLHKGLTVIF